MYYTADTFSGVDSGSSGTMSKIVNLKSASLFSWWAQVDTGTIASCVITLQCSPDNENWFSTPHTLTFSDESNQEDVNLTIGAQYIRFKITTKSAIASTVNVQINAK